RLTVRFTPRLPESDTQDYRFSLEVEVAEAGRLPVTGRGSALVTRGDFRLELEPDRWVVSPGSTLSVKLRAVDYEGRPQAGLPVTLAAGAREVGRFVTDAGGRARATLPAGERGDLRLTARASDARGR